MGAEFMDRRAGSFYYAVLKLDDGTLDNTMVERQNYARPVVIGTVWIVSISAAKG